MWSGMSLEATTVSFLPDWAFICLASSLYETQQEKDKSNPKIQRNLKSNMQGYMNYLAYYTKFLLKGAKAKKKKERR